MKAIALAILLLLPARHMMGQAYNDAASEGLKGRVKVMTEVQCYEGFKQPYMKTVAKYDPMGRLAEEIHNDYALKLYFRKTIQYDTTSSGAILKQRETDDSGRLVRAIEYAYDSMLRLAATTDVVYYDGEQLVYKNEYGYDSSGHKVQEKNYTDGVLDHNTVYKYDHNGRVAGAKSYDRKDKLAMEYDYNYLAGADWAHCEKQVGAVRTHIFRIIDTAGQLVEKTTYVHDYSKQTIESYSSFDRHGNWLKESVKGTVMENYFVTRTIEYYKD